MVTTEILQLMSIDIETKKIARKFNEWDIEVPVNLIFEKTINELSEKESEISKLSEEEKIRITKAIIKSNVKNYFEEKNKEFECFKGQGKRLLAKAINSDNYKSLLNDCLIRMNNFGSSLLREMYGIDTVKLSSKERMKKYELSMVNLTKAEKTYLHELDKIMRSKNIKLEEFKYLEEV